MQLSPLAQESMVSLLLTDDEHAPLVESLVPVESFDPFYNDVAAAAIGFRKRYGKVAGEHLIDIFDDLQRKKPKSADIYKRIYKTIRLNPVKNKQFVLDQASMYARFRNAGRIHERVTEYLEKNGGGMDANKLTELENIFAEIKKPIVGVADPGLNLADPTQALRFLNEADGQFFLTSIKEFDDRKLCPTRKKLFLFMASSGKGKSWFLDHLAVSAMIHHRINVGIITLEMSEDDYAERLLQTMFSVATKKEKHKYVKFKRNDKGMGVGFIDVVLDDRKTFESPGVVGEITRGLNRLQPNIRIKSFPTGELTVDELDAFLTAWEWRDNFVPDMLLIDYPDLMKIDPHHERESITSIYRRLRGQADRRNYALVVPTQSNTAGDDAKVLNRKHVGLSIEKYNIADFVVGYMQTSMEKSRGLARLHAAKGRKTGDGFTVMISQAYSLGQFCVDSVRMPESDYTNLVNGGDDE